MHDRGAGRAGLADEGVEHGAGRIGDRKELSRVFALHLHPRLAEELHGVVDSESPEHLADRRWRAAGVVCLRDLPVRDVAAAAPGDENLRAELAGPVDGDDREPPA